MLLQAQDVATLRSLEHVFRDTGGGNLMYERKMLTRLGEDHLMRWVTVNEMWNLKSPGAAGGCHHRTKVGSTCARKAVGASVAGGASGRTKRMLHFLQWP
jgi:hypothetical protein